MINLSPFRYASTKVGFGTAGSTAADKAEENSSKVSSLLATSVSGASSSSPFESASQDQISGASELAANAAIARVNKQKKAQSEALLKQIDAAQASVDQAKIEAELKQRYYVYMLPATPLVDTEA